MTTILLPYATVPELEEYAQGQDLDGILFCGDREHEPNFLFRVMPYPSPEDFDRALRASPWFGPPRVQGGWRWYPVRRPTSALRNRERPPLEHP